MSIVLHIPHASTVIPAEVRDQFLVNQKELGAEIQRLTDHATDRIFADAFQDATACVFPVSRFVVDPERFEHDAREPMAQKGMGVIYTHGTNCQPIRRGLTYNERQALLESYYHPHHRELTWAVQRHIEKFGKCLILDSHSFTADALPCEQYPNAERPDFCLGTDTFHTPETLVANAERELKRNGFSVARDEPFKGTLVPTEFYRCDRRVRSLMIEVNRRLYMNDDFTLCERGLERVVAVLSRLGPVLDSSI